MAKRKPKTKAGKKAKAKKVMGEFKRGNLRSGSKTGPKVKSKKQAIAIAMSESGQGRKRKK
ncbi:MAG: DUF6496 domain-containing protein [Pseudohongiellaceae bacterium]